MVSLYPKRFHSSTYKKLQTKKTCPFWILNRLGENAYLLELPLELHFSPIFTCCPLNEVDTKFFL